MSKTIETRISQKHDFESKWNLTSGFIPREGEIIVYDAETNGEGTVFVEAYMQGSSTNFTTSRTDPIPYARIKIGDGVTDVKDLEFSSSGEGVSGDALQAHIEDKNNPHNVTSAQIGAASTTYVDNAINAAITAALEASY